MPISPEVPQEDTSRPAIPALLRANTGESIVPTQKLPGVDFEALLDPSGSDSQDTERPPPRASEEADAQGSSYFPSQSGDSADVIQTTNRRNDPPEEVDFDPPTPNLKSHRTAPLESTRSTLLQQGSNLFQTSFAGRQPQRANTAGMKHKYGQMPYDSDSSSEDEHPAARQKLEKDEDASGQGNNGVQSGQMKNDSQEGSSNGKARQKRPQAQRKYTHLNLGNEHFRSKGKISKRDGRLNISINETENTGYIAKALGRTVNHHLDVPGESKAKVRRHNADHDREDIEAAAAGSATSADSISRRPSLNIVVMVIGSRGDIQPFLEIGRKLSEYGHRVRIATHPKFREFVNKETDLEFFSIGGDPSELMAFMVKNPGLVPNLKTIREGEVQRRRTSMKEMFEGMWRSCTNVTDDEKDYKNAQMMGDKYPFIADAIIANPPSMAHVHIAERLGIPLHIMFTFPFSPTSAFPHPLANIKPGKSNVDAHYVNWMSYPMVEMMTWQGLGDIVNSFRVHTLGLEPVSSLWAPGALYRMRVPYTYMWSPSLVPKPADWGPEIDLAGFVFMDLANNFKPPDDLAKFLEEGDPPVYIGFGSIVIDDPDAFTDMIFKATKMAGVRALVNKGWGGLGQSNDDTPDNIFMLGNTPHDWLFPKVKAVIHHGGAGTTAIGLKCAKPTMIVPFFGDQPFWGARVSEAKAGAHECIPWKDLTVEKFAEGIKQCLTEEAQKNVQEMADGMKEEGNGAENAVKSFHRSLPLAGRHSMRCSILEDRVAVWQLRSSSLRFSALAAEILIEKGKVQSKDLKLLRHMEWNDFDGPGEPISGIGGALMDSFTGMGSGIGMVPVRVAKHMKKRSEHEKRKQERLRKREERKQKREEQKGGKKGTNMAKNGEQENGNKEGDKQEKNEESKDGKEEDKKEDDGKEKEQDTAQRPDNNRTETTATGASALSADPSEPAAAEVAEDVGTGLLHSGAALATMPVDIGVALAQGFHNAPRLWGDSTVRKPTRITGFKSGVVAARNEFAYGIYDAWSGVVMQPINGWRDGDTAMTKVAGAGTGVGKGIGGFVLKNVSAIISPPAYVSKGAVVYLKKLQEPDGPGSKAFIRRAHLTQGSRDLYRLRNQNSSEGDNGEGQLEQIESRVMNGWKIYEELWSEARRSLGHDLRGRLRFRYEMRKWYNAGALENVHTAKRALEVRKSGGDLDEHFRKRMEEMRLAEAPRAGAMEQPEIAEEKDNILPNGRKREETSEPKDEEIEKGKKVGGRGEGEEVREADEEEEQEEEIPEEEDDRTASSDATAVETPEAEPTGKQGFDDFNPPHVDAFKTLSGGDQPALGRLQVAAA